MKLLSYESPPFSRFQLGSSSVIFDDVVRFLHYVLKRDQLEIADYLEDMEQAPFFLLAATGLGKTVGVPIHLLLRQMQRAGKERHPSAQVWVVEPRIPIATEQMSFMNILWKDYWARHAQTMPALFGCITSVSGHQNRHALITFVTTGVFELLATANEFLPSRDRIVIDEAHVTIEQNVGVELAIALTKRAGVTVDFMSATIDTTNLQATLGIETVIRADKQRHTIWKHNLLLPLDEALIDLLEATLVHPDPTSSYFPQPGEFAKAQEIVATVQEPNRSHGMLIVINSFAGEYSDSTLLAEKARNAFPELPVLLLASEVIRDPRNSAEFERQLRAIEAAKQNYLIIATSVVEMGITFPTLDFAVTMDSGYEQETVGDRTFPVLSPLGINSLTQRIGRVGRRRPAIAYISLEIGASYATLDDKTLNQPRALAFQPLRFPAKYGSLLGLAYYLCRLGEDPFVALQSLHLPSQIEQDTDRIAVLREQLAEFEALGITREGQLTEFGKNIAPWVGRAELAYVVTLLKAIAEDVPLPELMFWVVATALSYVPLRSFVAPSGFCIDYQKQHEAIQRPLESWLPDLPHEDIAVFILIARLAQTIPMLFWPRMVEDEELIHIFKWYCIDGGLDFRGLRRAGKAIEEIWHLLEQNSPQFVLRFYNKTLLPSLSTLEWQHYWKSLPAQGIVEKLTELPGSVQVSGEWTKSGWRWSTSDITPYCSGVHQQDFTPILLKASSNKTTIYYSARLNPSRSDKSGALEWRLMHIGEIVPKTALVSEPSSTQPVVQKKRQNVFIRIIRWFGLIDGSEDE